MIGHVWNTKTMPAARSRACRSRASHSNAPSRGRRIHPPAAPRSRHAGKDPALVLRGHPRRPPLRLPSRYRPGKTLRHRLSARFVESEVFPVHKHSTPAPDSKGFRRLRASGRGFFLPPTRGREFRNHTDAYCARFASQKDSQTGPPSFPSRGAAVVTPFSVSPRTCAW